MIAARAQGDAITEEIPAGLDDAREKLVGALLDLCPKEQWRKLVIGGFSQGSMLALDLALRSDTKFAGVIAMSSTLICSGVWKPLMESCAGMPLVLSHGRNDEILPFRTAETLRDLLATAGLPTEWVEFSGGHEIPPPVLAAAGRLVTSASESQENQS